ncbi:hypothetical protein [Streptomyces sp. NPDC058739]|uniref:hypothetical protein n=1 Tax=Streptomyces sp. NPDC058739 TaxID=3346618 RepID=UPI0036A5438A
MTSALPAGFSPLPFNPARGLPQQVRVTANGRALAVTLVAMTGDIVGTLTLDRTRVVVDGAEEHATRDASREPDVRAGLTARPPDALGSAAVRPYLVVLDGGRVIGSAPVVVGRPMAFGTSQTTGLVIEILVTELRLAAGALVEPGDVGSRIVAGFREAGAGGPPLRGAVPREGNVHDLLV